MSYWQWDEIQAHASYLVPSMGPILSFPVMTSTLQRSAKFCSRKAGQLAMAGNDTVHGQCMSVGISWSDKLELAKYDNLVGFPKLIQSQLAVTISPRFRCPSKNLITRWHGLAIRITECLYYKLRCMWLYFTTTHDQLIVVQLHC